MGGDYGPEVTIPASLDRLKNNPDLKLILVGDEAVIAQHLAQNRDEYRERLTIKHASQCVAMDESPAKALKNKKDSSMRIAINLVHDGYADACVSAGNTGALMATARFVLKMIPGIDRPAIISTLPTIYGHTHALDLGANVDCTAEHLFQFAVMGAELVKAVENIENPRVGLLNIGEEDVKGNEQVKAAAKLLENSALNYIGYVEGDSLNAGNIKVDLIVVDGFVGNVALKSIEGAAKMIGTALKDAFSKNSLTKLAGLIVYPVLKSFRKRIDPRLYNGASFLGLRGLVIKSHGGADILAFRTAVHLAEIEIKKDVIRKISEQVEKTLAMRETA
ncbi:fatty acid/phospholipid synthesis protein [Candidatus Methylobacter favarea]|uniref:Phosphate acyltransferase n=2 Tax=Candidatus Methylobacter favarea TaxID=2707345 RepID=A0A8S0X7K1_9GAMM|nr:fatty acid/phospholipid synthesis protein [Candidatus Methylobacter favarea]